MDATTDAAVQIERIVRSVLTDAASQASSQAKAEKKVSRAGTDACLNAAPSAPSLVLDLERFNGQIDVLFQCANRFDTLADRLGVDLPAFESVPESPDGAGLLGRLVSYMRAVDTVVARLSRTAAALERVA